MLPSWPQILLAGLVCDSGPDICKRRMHMYCNPTSQLNLDSCARRAAEVSRRCGDFRRTDDDTGYPRQPKNTKVSSNRYVVFEELLSNSIDSFLIRQHTQPSALDLTVTVDVRLFASDLLGEELDVAITCSDNGCGLGPEQIDAFLTSGGR